MSNNCHEITGYKLSPIITGVKLSPLLYAAKLSPIVEGVGCADDFASIEYLFNDEFPNDQAAPMPAAWTSDPGNNPATITDTQSTMSVSGGELIFANTTSTSDSDPLYESDDTFTPANGMAIGVTLTGATTSLVFEAGNLGFGFELFNNASLFVKNWIDGTSSFQRDAGFTLNAGVEVTIVAALTPEGLILFKKQAGTWELGIAPYSTEYPQNGADTLSIHSFGAGETLDLSVSSVKLRQLFAPFTQSCGLCTESYTGTVTQGQSFTHPVQFSFTFTFTAGVSDTKIDFRIQTAGQDYWQQRMTTGNQLQLIEYTGGVGVQRNAQGGYFGGGGELVTEVESTFIKMYSSTTPHLRTTYSTTLYNTETAGQVSDVGGAGGDVSDLLIYNKDASSYADQLDTLV